MCFPIGRFVGGFVRHGCSYRSEYLFRHLFIRYRSKHLVGVRVISPGVRLRIRRKGGVLWKVPAILRYGEGSSYAVRWFRESVRNRVEKKFIDRFLGEWGDVFEGRGRTVKKCGEVHRVAWLNRGMVRIGRRHRIE